MFARPVQDNNAETAVSRPVGGSTCVSLLEKLPTMPDDGLKTLQTNAQRLEQNGSATQRASATAILPAIEAELASRRDAKRAAASAARPPKAAKAVRGRSRAAKVKEAAEPVVAELHG
jgi:hypothetical protein